MTAGDSHPSSGNVPTCGNDSGCVDSLAILAYLADNFVRNRYWPIDDVARGIARSMVAEMHSAYQRCAGADR